MSRSRWLKRVVTGAIALAVAGGCKQQLMMDPADYKAATSLALPKELETNPHGPISPGVVERLGQVSTVEDFALPPRNMTLRECIALALEKGNVGSQAPNNPGFKNEALEQFAGRNVGGTDAIRAFAIDPAIAQVEIERSLSKFDARWINTMQWQKIDQPVAAQFLSFQQSRDAALFSSTLAKPLPTGGVAGITFSTDYSKFSQSALNQAQTGLINPNYTPRVQLTLEQPLLRQFGVEVNQIAPNHPGSLLLQGVQPTGAGTEGILVTRIRQDQSRANFDLQINYMLLNVEAAYWNLYAAYYNLYAQEEGLRQAFDGYRFTELRVRFGGDPPQNLDQAQAQFERFRRQVYQARGQVLESERQLRGLIGLRSDEGVRLVPIDNPNLAPFKPDFHESANDAIANRPELMIARQDVKLRQLELLLQRNLRRPDLRGFAQYDMAGLGTRLDGRTQDFGANGVVSPGNAFGSFIDNRFNSWTLGLRLDIPLGFRDANALVRQAELNMSKSYIQLRDSELKATEFVMQQYRKLIQAHKEIAPARAERESLQKYLARTREVIKIGSWNSQYFLNYLTVQQQLAQAISAETKAIADYNIALAQFEFAKGTIQQYNNVTIGEGPLPPWVSKRAADYIRERTEAALKLREQPAPAAGPAIGGHPVSQVTMPNSQIQLPPFAENRGPLPESLPKMTEPLPPAGGAGAPQPRPIPGGVQPLPGGGGASIPLPLPTYGGGSPGTATGQPDFVPEGRATIPQPLPYRPSTGMNPTPETPNTGTGVPAPGNNSGENFQPEGRLKLPPPPPLPGSSTSSKPIWGDPPVNPASAGSVAPPAIPPSLPPLPGNR